MNANWPKFHHPLPPENSGTAPGPFEFNFCKCEPLFGKIVHTCIIKQVYMEQRYRIW